MTPDQNWFVSYIILCSGLGVSSGCMILALALGLPILMLPFGAAFAFFLYFASIFESTFMEKYGGVIYLRGQRPLNPVGSVSVPENFRRMRTIMFTATILLVALSVTTLFIVLHPSIP